MRDRHGSGLESAHLAATMGPESRALFYAVGRSIRCMREARHLSVHELAHEIHISDPVLSRMELGRRQITLTNLINACEALNIEPVNLFRLAQEEAFPLGWNVHIVY